MIKNPSKGPLTAIKHGFLKGNSDAVIVYPADDFLNYNLLDGMFKKYTEGNEIVVASRFIEGIINEKLSNFKSLIVRSSIIYCPIHIIQYTCKRCK